MHARLQPGIYLAVTGLMLMKSRTRPFAFCLVASLCLWAAASAPAAAGSSPANEREAIKRSQLLGSDGFFRPGLRTLSLGERAGLAAGIARFKGQFLASASPIAALTYVKSVPGYATKNSTSCCRGHCRGCRFRRQSRLKNALASYLSEVFFAGRTEQADPDLRRLSQAFDAGQPLGKHAADPSTGTAAERATAADRALKQRVLAGLLPFVFEVAANTPSRDAGSPLFVSAVRVIDRALAKMPRSERLRLEAGVGAKLSEVLLNGQLALHDKSEVERASRLYSHDDLPLISEAVRFFLGEDGAQEAFALPTPQSAAECR